MVDFVVHDVKNGYVTHIDGVLPRVGECIYIYNDREEDAKYNVLSITHYMKNKKSLNGSWVGTDVIKVYVEKLI